MVANPEPKDTTDPTSAVDLDAMPIRERDRWIAATLRFMRDRGYTVTSPGVVPDALTAARAERDTLAEIVSRSTEIPALLAEITRLTAAVERERRPNVDGIAAVIREHQPTTGMSVASGVTCRCGYWNGNEVGGTTRPVGYQGLQWHQAEAVAAHLRALTNEHPSETEYAVTTNPSMGVAMTPERLASLAAAEPCAACSGPVRRTVGMVCQVCGKDYAPSDPKPMTMPIPYADLIAQAQHGERLCVCGQPWSPDAEHRTNSPCLLRTRPGGER